MVAEYLQQLRARPLGSRPAPFARTSTLSRDTSIRPTDTVPTHISTQNVDQSTKSAIGGETTRSARSPFDGRPLINQPSTEQARLRNRNSLSNVGAPPANTAYVERGSRWMEKQETKSLRMALEEMDMAEERRLHAAAQDEAAELIWQHRNAAPTSQNPHAPYMNPDRNVVKDYRSHLRRGSYQRSIMDQNGETHESQPLKSRDSRSSLSTARRITPPTNDTMQHVRKQRSTSGKKYDALAEAVASDIEQARRRSSGGQKRIMSGEKKIFMNPNDRIWEDPTEHDGTPRKSSGFVELTQTAPVFDRPRYARKNPFDRIRRQQESLERTNSAPELHVLKHDTVEIHRNSPSQSRDPRYTRTSPQEPAHAWEERRSDLEVRGDDIRAATSKFRSDRSPRLPQPVLVSDQPGRPIVSFKTSPLPDLLAKAGTSSSRASGADVLVGARPTLDSRTVKPFPRKSGIDSPGPTITPIPRIVFPGAEDDDGHDDGMADSKARSDSTASANSSTAPAIIVSDRARGSTREVEACTESSRPSIHHSASAPLPGLIPHLTPTLRPSGAACAHCALPIAGRIVSAAGQRFHPSCFVCHECDTNLELVAFYPEPETKRAERSMTSKEGVDSGDHDLRFYCHLDYHELFSPRCKSCKTPIEGEMIVACGAEWHAGHFFCAQCGDPFDQTTPFVEKDGYAWCVGCHTHRYSSKCRKCRKPVTDLVVKALDFDWHEDCFVCVECNAPFTDGKFFLRGDGRDPACVACEARRLKR